MCIRDRTGFVLTALTMIQPLLLPAIVTETGFSHNHTNMYVMAYACWNIKFASIHQDDGTLFHIGHSHLPALISCFLYGTGMKLDACSDNVRCEQTTWSIGSPRCTCTSRWEWSSLTTRTMPSVS
eukprot:TRINITY_DN1250_c0_g1_i6.p1 TRINITY_DN1250_c0_g1~~TRINITY_DN1250_c0_g1_i6.p1  ORF type:complete len:125 (-),score=5.40 TRINITY_DN1250_c0_g1_i6:108-482(-)